MKRSIFVFLYLMDCIEFNKAPSLIAVLLFNFYTRKRVEWKDDLSAVIVAVPTLFLTNFFYYNQLFENDLLNQTLIKQLLITTSFNFLITLLIFFYYLRLLEIKSTKPVNYFQPKLTRSFHFLSRRSLPPACP